MERVFLQDRGRYKAGMRKDYPLTTWRSFFPGYERFTQAVDEALMPPEVMPRRPGRPRKVKDGTGTDA